MELSAQQVARIEAIEAQMRAEAIEAGTRLIEAEAALSGAFRDGMPDRETLVQLIAAAEAARGDLRFIHLSRHLETQPILSETQTRRYGVLRGYADDPCAAGAPDGHDAANWRRHNGCM
ncbi:hypothetical protein [Palleronia abyssalis]|uniref:Uncharacterized protein n=1 Tax=Palleronia abyssalis TaxID=1501240 RepID=A0A2R8C196_9RHOB|nr:hypothetical protein [Palleronia abyssalis]SPJ26162.1 hypothetical protein PAA8504_04018 [Palleronia abyssalis]